MPLVPAGGAYGKELRQRGLTQALPGPGQGTLGNIGIHLVGQSKAKMGSHIRNRLMAIKSERYHQPHHLLRRKFAAPYTRLACRR